MWNQCDEQVTKASLRESILLSYQHFAECASFFFGKIRAC